MDTLPLFTEAVFSLDTPAAAGTPSGAASVTDTALRPQVMTYEQFATLHGASRQDIGDAGFHSPAGHVSASSWRRLLDAQAEKDRNLIALRAQLQQEYDLRVAAGVLREPTHRERIVGTARGMDELESVQAARRICARRGWDWREALEPVSRLTDSHRMPSAV